VRGPSSLLVTTLVLVGALLAACGTAPRPVGLLASLADLRGARYVVGGGETDELELLCQLGVAAVEAAGARTDDQCRKIGSVDVRASESESEVDTGWAYVGRADRNLDDRPDPATSFAELARLDAAEGLTWLAPTAAADTPAVVVSAPVAASGLRTVSDLAARAAADPRVVLCGTPESARDPRGLGGLLAVYGIGPATPVRAVDGGAVLADTARGTTCTAGVVPGTSGRIPALGLVALVDDRDAFGRALDGRPAPGRGGAAPVMRTPVFAAHPQVAAVLDALTARLTDDVLRELDRRITVEGRDPRDVARTWMREAGLIA